jgi:hypothetical protein
MLKAARQAFGRMVDYGTDYLLAGLYWFATRALRPSHVGGLQLLDVRGASDEDEEYLRRSLAEALEMISSARAGFGELVTGHLRLVVVSGTSWDVAASRARAYITPFGPHSRANSQYLACRLIWAATWIRLARDMNAQGRRRDYELIENAAMKAQVRFVQQFPEPAQWEQYLRRGPRGPHRQAGA